MCRASCLTLSWHSRPQALRLALLGLAVGLLAGCGFQLRGTGAMQDLPPLYLHGDQRSETWQRVQRSLDLSGAELVSEPDARAWRVRIANERESERTLTVTDRALAADFELTLEVEYEVRDAADDVLRSLSRAEVSRVYRLDPDNVAGSARERELLRGEMAQELAQQVLGALSSLARQQDG